MDAVKKYCNKAILIKDGEIIASGDRTMSRIATLSKTSR